MKHLIIILFAALCCVGCSQYVAVTGTVTYSDGTPVTRGQVVFENETFLGRADVQSDGSYRMGRLKDGDGIPSGTYRVYLSDTDIYEPPAGGEEGVWIARPQVHAKYTNADTSELTCTVEGRTVFNFVVERP